MVSHEPSASAGAEVKRLRISGCSAAFANSAPGPSCMPQTTAAPTARKATSFTTDSKAMAATIPS